MRYIRMVCCSVTFGQFYPKIVEVEKPFQLLVNYYYHRYYTV